MDEDVELEEEEEQQQGFASAPPPLPHLPLTERAEPDLETVKELLRLETPALLKEAAEAGHEIWWSDTAEGASMRKAMRVRSLLHLMPTMAAGSKSAFYPKHQFMRLFVRWAVAHGYGFEIKQGAEIKADLGRLVAKEDRQLAVGGLSPTALAACCRSASYDLAPQDLVVWESQKGEPRPPPSGHRPADRSQALDARPHTAPPGLAAFEALGKGTTVKQAEAEYVERSMQRKHLTGESLAERGVCPYCHVVLPASGTCNKASCLLARRNAWEESAPTLAVEAGLEELECPPCEWPGVWVPEYELEGDVLVCSCARCALRRLYKGGGSTHVHYFTHDDHGRAIVCPRLPEGARGPMADRDIFFHWLCPGALYAGSTADAIAKEREIAKELADYVSRGGKSPPPDDPPAPSAGRDDAGGDGDGGSAGHKHHGRHGDRVRSHLPTGLGDKPPFWERPTPDEINAVRARHNLGFDDARESLDALLAYNVLQSAALTAALFNPTDADNSKMLELVDEHGYDVAAVLDGGAAKLWAAAPMVAAQLLGEDVLRARDDDEDGRFIYRNGQRLRVFELRAALMVKEVAHELARPARGGGGAGGSDDARAAGASGSGDVPMPDASCGTPPRTPCPADKLGQARSARVLDGDDCFVPCPYAEKFKEWAVCPRPCAGFFFPSASAVEHVIPLSDAEPRFYAACTSCGGVFYMQADGTPHLPRWVRVFLGPLFFIHYFCSGRHQTFREFRHSRRARGEAEEDGTEESQLRAMARRFRKRGREIAAGARRD